jgi:DNA-binding NarL/FixJ family response regulator
MGTPLPHEGLAGPLSVYVAARDGFTAGRVRQALEREGFQLTFEWGTLAELAQRRRRNVEVVVVVEGDEAPTADSLLAAVRELAPGARVVVICSPRRERPQALLRLRIDGIVVEPGADAIVGPLVRVVLSDYLAVPRSLRTAVDVPALNARDRELLALVVEGLTNREIAERLYLAESTVKRHLSALFRRLGVSSRAEAAAAAVLASDQMFRPGSGKAQ